MIGNSQSVSPSVQREHVFYEKVAQREAQERRNIIDGERVVKGAASSRTTQTERDEGLAKV